MSPEEKKVLEAKSSSIVAYSKYVNEHIANVHLAFASFGAKICHDLEERYKGIHGLHAQVRKRVMKHDDSKFSETEFIPYVQKFYAWEGMDKTPEEVAEEFDKAWMHHCKHNDLIILNIGFSILNYRNGIFRWLWMTQRLLRCCLIGLP